MGAGVDASDDRAAHSLGRVVVLPLGTPPSRHPDTTVDRRRAAREPEVVVGRVDEVRQTDPEVRRRRHTVEVRQLAGPHEQVVAQLRPAALGEPDEGAAGAAVHERVVDHPQSP
jgi:hypothetical protein